MVILGIVEIIIGGLMTYFSGRCDPVEGLIRYFMYEGNDANNFSNKAPAEVLKELNDIYSGTKEITVIKIIGIAFILIGIALVILGIVKQFSSSISNNQALEPVRIMSVTNIVSALSMGIIVFTGPLFGVVKYGTIQSFFGQDIFFDTEKPKLLDYIGFCHTVDGKIDGGSGFFIGLMLVLFVISIIAVIAGQFVSAPKLSAVLSAMPLAICIITFMVTLLSFTLQVGVLITVYSSFAWWLIISLYIFVFNVVRVNSD